MRTDKPCENRVSTEDDNARRDPRATVRVVGPLPPLMRLPSGGGRAGTRVFPSGRKSFSIAKRSVQTYCRPGRGGRPEGKRDPRGGPSAAAVERRVF